MEGQKYRCDYCGHTAPDRQAMLEHMLTHTAMVEGPSAAPPAPAPAASTHQVSPSPSVPSAAPPMALPAPPSAGPPPRVAISREDLQAAFRRLNFRAGLLWQDEHFMRKLIYEKAGLKSGDRVLLLCEDNQACRFPYELRQLIGPNGELADVDFRAMAYQHFAWDIYTDLCRPYTDGHFDAVVTVSWHHIDDLEREAKALVRVVRPGGRVVMVDHGPGHLYFEAMQHDVHLNRVLKLLVTYWGSIWKEDLNEAYEYAKDLNLRITADDVERAFRPHLKDMGRFETRGMALVWGVKA